MIARRRILAGENRVAPHLRRRSHKAGLAGRPGAGLGPGQHAGARHSLVHGESQREGFSRFAAALTFGRGQSPRAARVDRHAIWIARPAALPIELRRQRGKLATAFKARIEQTLRFKARDRRLIIGKMLALPAHRLLPADAEPAQVLVDRLFVFRAAALGIDIFDA